MRIARFAEVPWLPHDDYRTAGKTVEELEREGKQPRSLRKVLFKGTPGQTGNFEMLISSYRTPKYYPRHRHNIDQLRYTLKGTSSWGPEVGTPEGSLLYVPAGTWYGLYTRDAGLELMSVQFEEANGAPFVDTDTLFEAQRELAAKGSFEKGVYTWTDESGKRHSLEASRAGWEQVTGQKEEYPPARFSVPIEMNPDNFSWLDIERGVQIKELGTFTERETRLAMLGLDVRASYRLASPGQTTLLFVTAGSGTVDGEGVGRLDGIMLDPGDSATLATGDRLELLLMGLPKLVGSTSTSAVDQFLRSHA